MRRIRFRETHPMLSLFIVVAAAGCSSTPQRVVSVGQDAFRVSASAPSFSRQSDANEKAFHVAKTFCGQMGGQVLFRESQESGVHTWSPKQEDLIFVCAPSADAGTLQASLR